MNEITASSMPGHPGYFKQTNTSSYADALDTHLRKYRTNTVYNLGLTGVVEFYNASAGEYVVIRPEYSFCPVLMTSQEPIFLFEFVDVLDGLINYDRVKEELPGISYAQIHGAISFIRKLLQFNVRGLDPDDLLEEMQHNDTELFDQLRRSISTENSRVLYFNK